MSFNTVDDDALEKEDIKQRLENLEGISESQPIITENIDRGTTGLSGVAPGGNATPFPTLYPKIDHGSVGSGTVAINLDRTDAHVHKITLTGDISISFTNPPTTRAMFPIFLELVQDGTGGHTVTFVQTINPTSPTISTSASARTVLLASTVDFGSTYEIYEVGGGGGGSGTSDHSVKVTKSSTQSIPHNTATIVTFDQETYDTDGYHDNVTNNSRLTIPTGLGGKYLVVGQLRWDDNSTGERSNQLVRNGTTQEARFRTNAISDSESISPMLLDLDEGDYVELQAFQTSGGGALSLTTFITSFSLQKVDGGGSGSGTSFPIRPTNDSGLPTTGTVTIDLNQAAESHVFPVGPITGDIDITFSNPPPSGESQSFIIEVTQDGTGHNVTWNDTINGIVPTVDTTAGTKTLFAGVVTDGGSTYWVFRTGNAPISVSDFADKQLSDLTGTTAIPVSLLFSTTGLDIADTTNPVNAVFLEEARFQSGTIVANKPMITSVGGNSLDINHPTGSGVNFHENGTSAVTIDGGGLITSNNLTLQNILTLNDNAGDPLSNGQFARNSTDVKVFSGGSVRNLSDIGAANLPVADTTAIVQGSVTSTKQLRFEVDGFTAATTRVITPPDADINLPGTNIANTWTEDQTHSADILFSDSVRDIADSTNVCDNIFLNRVRFPNNDSITSNAFNILRNTFDSVDSLVLNVPSARNIVLSENATERVKVDFVSGIFNLDNSGGDMSEYRITASSNLWSVSKSGSGAALYTCADGHEFTGGNIDINNNSLTEVAQIDIETAAGATVGSIIGTDLSTDILEIRTAATTDFAVTDNGSNRLFFNNTLNFWDASGSSEFRLPVVVRIQDTTTVPSTPSSGNGILFLEDDGSGNQTLRFRFDNGTTKDIVDDT